MYNKPQQCYVCGSKDEFNQDSEGYVFMREIKCKKCGASIRNSSVSKTILDAFRSPAKSLHDAVKEDSFSSLKIYEVSSLGPIHETLKTLKGYVCSEYFSASSKEQEIRNENLENLSFENNCFDLVISQDVLEHVKDYKKAFTEINRVLKTNGKHIFTIPLHEGIKTRTRTTIYDYNTLPPVLHGDYMNSQGSLVYTDFGNDINDIISNFGFKSEAIKQNIWFDESDITNIETVDDFLNYKKTSNNKYQWKYNDIVIVSSKKTEYNIEQVFSGERFLPELVSPKISYEHLHRYDFVSKFVHNKIVVDIACGDGYGSNILSKYAKKVYGFDIDEKQINIAKNKYNVSNLVFSVGSTSKINIADKTIDVLISLETIEHISKREQQTFLKEVKRILKDDGLLIMSTPNKYVCSDVLKHDNKFHKHEMYLDEYENLLKKYFYNTLMFGQSIYESSQIWVLDKEIENCSEKLYEITPSGFVPTKNSKEAEYYIVLSSNSELPSADSLSLFTDISHSYLADVKNQLLEAKKKCNDLEKVQARLQELESSTSWKITKPLRSGMDFVKKSTINTRIQTKKQLDKLSPYIPQPIKNTIKPVYHRLFSGIPNNSVLQLTLDKVDPDLVDDTLHRETMLDIFVFPVIDWHGRYQRPQQIISRLAKRGHRVFYISPTFNQTNSTDLEKSIKIGNINENIYQIQLPLSENINIYQDVLSQNQIEKLIGAINIIKNKFKISHSISIVHQPFWYPLVKAISRNKTVYDCMDDHSGFTTNTSKQSDLEDDLLSSSDCVTTTSASLYKKAQESNQNTALIRNGSDIKHFASLPQCQESLIKKPIIGYYGAISDWFDCELVARCAKQYPDYSFVLIGNTYGADLRSIKNLPNIHLLGEKTYEELPSLLSCFDVCLIPFKINDLTLATNPVKFYEYISSGKPVVTVDLPELKDHQDICYFSNTHQDFVDNIQIALDEDNNEIVSKRKAVALANSWKSRVDDFEKQIFKLYPSVSIIMITYGNLEYTKNCIESIFKYSRYPNFELIIIDNNSDDSTPVYLQEITEIYPNIKIILNKDNRGFAKANNQGIKEAKGEYIIFLNNDTIVTNDWIYNLVHHIQKDSSIGLLGPVTNSIGNEQKIDINYEDMEGMQKFAWNYTGQNLDKITKNKMLALFCTIARQSDLEKVGLLSEEYEVGMFEDDDLSQKIKSIDKQVVMTDDVFVHHIGRASFSKLDDQKYMAIFNKNKLIYENKWGPWTPHKTRERK